MSDELIPIGVVASLHVHPVKGGKPMQRVKFMMLQVGQGIEGAPKRTYDHRPARMKKDEKPEQRDVSFIHRNELQELEKIMVDELGAKPGLLTPGRVRANIEIGGEAITPSGLLKLTGQDLVIGTAIVRLTMERDPCNEMNWICQGLAALMKNGKQGIFAQIIQSGKITEGDVIYYREKNEAKKQ